MSARRDIRRIWAAPLIAGLLCLGLAACNDSDTHRVSNGPADSDTAPATSSAGPSAPTATASTGSSSAGPTDESDPRSPLTWKPRLRGDSDITAIIDAYEAYVTTYFRISGKPDPNDPAIPQVSTGSAQAYLIAAAKDAQKSGPVYGAATFYPEVTDADPSAGQATVVDCPDLSRFLRDGKASGPVQKARPIRATLTLAGGLSWKVGSYQEGNQDACVGLGQ